MTRFRSIPSQVGLWESKETFGKCISDEETGFVEKILEKTGLHSSQSLWC